MESRISKIYETYSKNLIPITKSVLEELLDDEVKFLFKSLRSDSAILEAVTLGHLISCN